MAFPNGNVALCPCPVRAVAKKHKFEMSQCVKQSFLKILKYHANRVKLTMKRRIKRGSCFSVAYCKRDTVKRLTLERNGLVCRCRSPLRQRVCSRLGPFEWRF